MDKNLSLIMERVVLGKEFKIYGTPETPYFLAKDVARLLDHTHSRMLIKNLEEDEKVVNNVYTLGGNQKTWFLTEAGLYEVLMQSRKPIAKLFRKEVKAILKEIRKNGIYATESRVNEMLENPDLAIEMLKKIKYTKEEVKALSAKLESQKPKVIFADAVRDIEDTIYIGDLAKLIRQNGVNIGQNRLFKWFRDNGYLIKKRGVLNNMPTQRAMDLNLFKIRETIGDNKEGRKEISKTVKVTGKGQVYFINKFLN